MHLSSGYKKPDHFTKKAKKEGFAARSVYKLEEIQRRFHLIKPGMRVLDLGCYPGSWSKYLIQKVGRSGQVVGVDLSAPAFGGAVWIEQSVFDVTPEEMLTALGGQADMVVSDMAPGTTGNRLGDHVLQIELADCAWNLAQKVLRPGGAFVAKVFDGEDANGFCARVKEGCGKTKRLKTEATRRQSREFFLVGQNFRGS
jgi:23S rRNA (uridine2552-2'-O)-methyltransferase